MITEKPHTKTFSTRLTADTYERMIAYCVKCRIKIWGFIEDAIVAALKKAGTK